MSLSSYSSQGYFNLLKHYKHILRKISIVKFPKNLRNISKMLIEDSQGQYEYISHLLKHLGLIYYPPPILKCRNIRHIESGMDGRSIKVLSLKKKEAKSTSNIVNGPVSVPQPCCPAVMAELYLQESHRGVVADIYIATPQNEGCSKAGD